MDIKSSIKQRREERIRDLLLREEPAPPSPQPVQEQPLWNKGRLPEPLAPEPDPEKVWKKEHAKGGGPSYHKSRFVSGFMWRVFFSVILFGLIWGLFQYPQPWSTKIQDYVMQSLNREMDFQAVEAWYESHFGEAPAFIPIFKQNQTSPLKVNASSRRRGRDRPIAGRSGRGDADLVFVHEGGWRLRGPGGRDSH
jgi:stage IV sporulation protein FA